MAPKKAAMDVDSDEDVSIPTFKSQTLEELFETAWKGKSTGISEAAIHLSGEALRLFVVDAIHRTAEVAKAEGAAIMEVKHFEQVASGLVLDF